MRVSLARVMRVRRFQRFPLSIEVADDVDALYAVGDWNTCHMMDDGPNGLCFPSESEDSQIFVMRSSGALVEERAGRSSGLFIVLGMAANSLLAEPPSGTIK
jgi:hypothetical protein